MESFIVKSDDIFFFTSKLAKDQDEIFTAIRDCYKTGYIIIDQGQQVYFLDNTTILERILDGTHILID